MMIRLAFATIVISLLAGCNAMKKMADEVYINQRTRIDLSVPRIDSLLIVASGTSATQQISEEFISLFQNYLKDRGVSSQSMFISYSGKRIDEEKFDNRRYAYTLWIYEQDRKMQLMEKHEYLVPLALKLTDNRSNKNVWIANSIVNNMVRKKYYKEKYAGMLLLIFRANGFL